MPLAMSPGRKPSRKPSPGDRPGNISVFSFCARRNLKYFFDIDPGHQAFLILKEVDSMDFIESQSLQLIKTVLDHYSLPDYGRFLVERAVHATADFSIASLFVIQPGFIETQ